MTDDARKTLPWSSNINKDCGGSAAVSRSPSQCNWTERVYKNFATQDYYLKKKEKKQNTVY